MNLGPWRLVVGLALLGASISLAGVASADEVQSTNDSTAKTAAKPTIFTAVARAHWKEWADGSDTITPERLDQLMRDRKIKGEAAAAVAAMKRNVKDPTTKQLTDWTMKRIEDYESLVASGKSKHSLDRAYKKSLDAIKTDPHALYANGAPHLASIHQARSGDCWLLATIGAIIHRDPHQLRSLISDDGDRRYTVHLAYHTFKVQAPSDAEIGTYSNDRGDGDWLYVVENAEGQYREDFNHLHKVSLANDAAITAGSGSSAIQNIVGHDADHINMTPAKPQTDRVRAALTRAFQEHRLVLVGTTHDKSEALPHGIAKGHAMAVFDFDPSNDMVTVWNPWGNTSTPKGTGPNDGYKTVGGVFQMPLPDFCRSFAHVSIENDKPYKPKK